jgi:hypothetical protein
VIGKHLETIIEGKVLLETTPMMHDALTFRLNKAKAQPAVSSQIKATVRAVISSM